MGNASESTRRSVDIVGGRQPEAGSSRHGWFWHASILSPRAHPRREAAVNETPVQAPASASSGLRVPAFAGPLLVALALLVAHLLTVDRYGIFHDELYYLACGQRLAWGYVDHPPLVAVLARLATTLFGDSLLAIRILPILCGLLTVWVADRIVCRLGGGSFARLVASVCIAAAPHFLFVFHVLSMNGPEVLLWTIGALAALVAVEDAPELRDVRDALRLTRFAPVTATDYAPLREAAHAADAAGYRMLF
jgi:hypothetical protein